MAANGDVSINEAKMQTIMENVHAKNTEWVSTIALKLFQDYCTFKGESANFANFTCAKLDGHLEKNYFDYKTKDWNK
jgi:hypothetical protein